MSDLRPKGVPVMIDGVERHLLFTLNVIDNIQEHFDMTLEEVIDLLTDKRKSNQTLKTILMMLLEDEVERKEYTGGAGELKKYSQKEIGWLVTVDNVTEILLAVLKAYGLSLPEPGDDFPNLESGTMNQ